jgi:hypothetical protein
MLVEAEYVAAGIAEARGDFGGVGVDRLNDLASVGGDGCEGCSHVVIHDVNHQTWSCRRRAAEDPCAADFSDAVVKRDGAIVALADLPAENFFLEAGGERDVGGGDFDVANFLRFRRLGASFLLRKSFAGGADRFVSEE